MKFDPEAVRAKYLAERDKRLVPGRADIRDLHQDRYFSGYRDDPFTPYTDREPVDEDLDVVILGGGIAGILAGVRLREAGVERIRIIDKAGGIGGTWYWNQYPGVMCDVESYIYMPMLEEFGYIPERRYAYGEEILAHLQAIAARYDLVDDALFHTGVTRAEWDEDASRWRVHTDRGDELRARWYVMGVGILNLLKLPAIPGMEEFAGRSFHTARWDYSYTGGGPHEPLTGLKGKSVALIGTGATGIQCLPPLSESAEHVYVFQRTPSAIGVRGNRPTAPDFADRLAPGWQRERMDNFQAMMLGRSVATDLIDDGWTHDYGPAQHPPRWEGMTPAEYMRNAEEFDFKIMEAHRHRVEELVADPEHGRDPQALLPLHLQAALLPRRVPAGLQQPERDAGRLPQWHRADHRQGPGRRREAVRGGLHHLRHGLRARAHPPLPPGRPRDRRTRRRHLGREVG